MILTKELLKELKECRSLVVRRDREGNTEMQLFFEDEVRGKKIDTDKSYLVDSYLVTNEVRDYDKEEYPTILEADPKNSICCAHVSFYHSQKSKASTLLKLLKVGDNINFGFYANYGNQYTAKAGLHHDIMEVRILRDDRYFGEFTLSESICPQNSARMINPSPSFMSNLKIDPTDSRYTNAKQIA